MDKVTITEKIRKLLALSQSPVEAEAKLALAKARELMMNWAIKEHELQYGTKAEFIEITIFQGEKRPIKVKLVCSILNKYFNVRILTVGRYQKSILCFGTKSNVEHAQYVYNFLCETFESLWLQTKHKLELNETYKKRYFFGLHDGFYNYLDFMKIPEKVETALLVIGKELTESWSAKHPKMSTQHLSVTVRDPLDSIIRAKGYQDGEKIRVTRPLDGDILNKKLLKD